MTEPATLFDNLYRASFNYSRGRLGIAFVDRPEQLRRDLRDARKFVLDDRMSAFLVDLSSAAFLHTSRKTTYRLVDQMRTMARLPFKRTWIEYDLAATFARARQLGLTSPFETPLDENHSDRTGRQGWLLNQHPTNETLFRCHIFEKVKLKSIDDQEVIMTPPFAYGWHTDDQQSVWAIEAARSKLWQSEMVVGIRGYLSDRCGILLPEYYSDAEPNTEPRLKEYTELVKIYSATLRRVWALLATVNDIPITAQSVVQAKGFVARGSYHKFLDYKIITLRVPDNTDVRKIARRAIAHARRRAHQVRGHWRKDHWRPGERLWISEHQRGDASLGFVTHDYRVEHPDSQE